MIRSVTPPPHPPARIGANGTRLVPGPTFGRWKARLPVSGVVAGLGAGNAGDDPVAGTRFDHLVAAGRILPAGSALPGEAAVPS